VKGTGVAPVPFSVSIDRTNEGTTVSDSFDDIIKGLPDEPNKGDTPLKHIWEAIEVLWPQFYPGNIMIKGVMVAECLDEGGDRVLRFIAHPDATPWDMVGMMDSAMGDARAMGKYVIFEEDEDDDE
jgi:hypothetical protein